MQLSTAIYALHPRTVFRISRAERAEMRNVFVRIGDEEITGYGEASPNAYYHENADDVRARLTRAAPLVSATVPPLPVNVPGGMNVMTPKMLET